MLPDPLHPSIVHFPIALSILVPLAALAALVAARRRPDLGRTLWVVVLALAVLLVGASWVALETGEQQEERVEEIVSERPLESHADRAQIFLVISWITLGLAAVGLARGGVGRSGRALATLAALTLIPAGIRVGHSGGELVYRHGAANAYQSGNGARISSVGGEKRRAIEGKDVE